MVGLLIVSIDSSKPLEIVILGVFSKLMSIDYCANSSFRRLSTISSSSCRTFGVQEEKSSAIPMPIWLIYVPLILPSAVNHRVVLCVNLSYIQKLCLPPCPLSPVVCGVMPPLAVIVSYTDVFIIV